MKGQLRLLSGRRLASPKGEITRPTTARIREAVMNIVRESINNSNWLDLFSGSGIMSCEAIQNGASNVVAVENNKKIYNICFSNISLIANATERKILFKAINSDVNKFLITGYKQLYIGDSNFEALEKKRFDYIYIDPPYTKKYYYSVLENLLLGDWVTKESLVICEFSIEEGITIPSNWVIKDKKTYGKTGLLFLNPTLA